jgi:hypothetical protein
MLSGDFSGKAEYSKYKIVPKRFFLWFDAFMLLKYLNYVNEKFYTRQPVRDESIRLARLIDLPVNNASTLNCWIYTEKGRRGLEPYNLKPTTRISSTCSCSAFPSKCAD